MSPCSGASSTSTPSSTASSAAAEDLAGQLPSADPVMARYARQYLDAMISRPDMTLADKVRWLVRDMLPLGRCSVEKVAQHLGVDRRTVHRHLAQSGETFSSLVDDVRGELAESYLEGNKGRLTDVADLLGFSALSALLALAQAPLRLHPDGKAQRQVALSSAPCTAIGKQRPSWHLVAAAVKSNQAPCDQGRTARAPAGAARRPGQTLEVRCR